MACAPSKPGGFECLLAPSLIRVGQRIGGGLLVCLEPDVRQHSRFGCAKRVPDGFALRTGAERTGRKSRQARAAAPGRVFAGCLPGAFMASARSHAPGLRPASSRPLGFAVDLGVGVAFAL